LQLALPQRIASPDEASFGQALPLFDSDYHFSSRAARLEIPDGFSDLTQAVTPVDYRCHLSCLHEIGEDGQVFLVQFRQKHDMLTVYERRRD
jgi:hypothetical protein